MCPSSPVAELPIWTMCVLCVRLQAEGITGAITVGDLKGAELKAAQDLADELKSGTLNVGKTHYSLSGCGGRQGC